MSVNTITKNNVTSLAQLVNLRQPVVSDGEILNPIRDRHQARVHELAIPTTRDEAWRFTDLSELTQVDFAPAPSVSLEAGQIELNQLPEAPESRLVFVNGLYSDSLSQSQGLPDGLYAGNLANLPPDQKAKLADYLGQQPGQEEVFTALNTASFQDMAVIWLRRGTVVEVPLQLLFVSVPDGQAMITQPRCLVVAEANSHLTLVEEFVSTVEGCPDSQAVAYFNNAVTEIWLEDNAELTHVRLQRDNGSAFHIGKTAVTQARDSRYACHTLNLGSQLSRQNLDVYQTGPGTETTLNGLTLIGKAQTSDIHSTVIYDHPNGTVNQLHKCIVGDKGHAVFDGRIVVRKKAQLTNANQLNRNLLLSPKARVNTKPQLEIVADNVKCSHGATVSQLEADEVFYLQSRGLDKTTSQNLLVDAFAAEILQKIPVVSLQTAIAQCVACRTISY
ncbi:Fe-S cluster assembly protein SufD [Sodalinema gerasimenkoae]|uniref:Fe-S cluster assembly protein SufD n=1 Tax=Sodalinema gerasimenkoae TaxID=2862348 RepID=UPI0013583884|nr:Fe-S cluster assembly protein SufD [Sodalinema gerasimenkoae]